MASAPGLGALVEAALSAWVLQPGRLAAALGWMGARAPALAALAAGTEPEGLRRLLVLAALGEEDAAGVDALLALMRLDVPDAAQTAARVANLAARLCGSEKAPAPMPARSPGVVLPWIDRLLGREPAERRRALALLPILDVAGAVAPLGAWEAAYGDRLARAEALTALGPERSPEVPHLQRVVAGVEGARAALPAAVSLSEALLDVSVLAEAIHEPFHGPLVRLLGALPADYGPLLRVRLAAHGAVVAACSGDDRRAAWLWEALGRELAAGANPGVLGPWADALDGKPRSYLEDNLLGELRRPVEVRRFAAALARLAHTTPVQVAEARRLSAALAGGLDVEVAVALVPRLVRQGAAPSDVLVRAAIALEGRDVTGLARALRLMTPHTGDLGQPAKAALAGLCEHAAAGGAAWLIQGLLERDGGRLVELAELVRHVPRRAWPALTLGAPPPPWIALHPAALRPALERLAAVIPTPRARPAGASPPICRRGPRSSARPRRCGRAPRLAKARPGGCATSRPASRPRACPRRGGSPASQPSSTRRR